MERPHGEAQHGMTEEQLKVYNQERLQHAKEQMALRSKVAENKERTNDLEGYLARKRREKLAWTKANKARVLKTAAGVRARAIASKSYECKTCGVSLQSACALAKHLASKAHEEQVRLAAGGTAKPVSEEALQSRSHAAKNKASWKHYCAVCDRAFNIKGHLDKHLASKKHLAKAAKHQVSQPFAGLDIFLSKVAYEYYYEFPYNPDRPPSEYKEQTNNKKKEQTGPEQGYGRVITDTNKTLLGFSRHPHNGPRSQLDRMNEIFDALTPGFEREVMYPKGCEGKGQVIRYGRKQDS
ncbi:hypothetical protein DV738_g261, partial [Chaetothyriales sp. CBS 135597]